MIINSVTDLKNVITPMMGDMADDNIVAIVVEEIRDGDHPWYGTDWGRYIDSLDLWQIYYENEK